MAHELSDSVTVKYFQSGKATPENIYQKILSLSRKTVMKRWYYIESVHEIKKLIAAYMVQVESDDDWKSESEHFKKVKELLTLLASKIQEDESVEAEGKGLKNANAYQKWGSELTNKLGDIKNLNDIRKLLEDQKNNEPVSVYNGTDEGLLLWTRKYKHFYKIIEDAKVCWQILRENQRIKEKTREAERNLLKNRKRADAKRKAKSMYLYLRSFAKCPDKSRKVTVSWFCKRTFRNAETARHMSDYFDDTDEKLELGDLISASRIYTSGADKYNSNLSRHKYNETLLKKTAEKINKGIGKSSTMNMEFAAAILALSSNDEPDEYHVNLLKVDKDLVNESIDDNYDSVNELMQSLKEKYKNSCLVKSYLELYNELEDDESKADTTGKASEKTKPTLFKPINKNKDKNKDKNKEENEEENEGTNEEDSKAETYDAIDPPENLVADKDKIDERKDVFYWFKKCQSTISLGDLLRHLVDYWFKYDSENLVNFLTLSNSTKQVVEHFEDLDVTSTNINRAKGMVDEGMKCEDAANILQKKKKEFDEYCTTYSMIKDGKIKAEMQDKRSARNAVKKWKKLEKRTKGNGNITPGKKTSDTKKAHEITDRTGYLQGFPEVEEAQEAFWALREARSLLGQ